jgi:hypothetical protein
MQLVVFDFGIDVQEDLAVFTMSPIRNQQNIIQYRYLLGLFEDSRQSFSEDISSYFQIVVYKEKTRSEEQAL